MTFSPSKSVIMNITQAIPALVTTTTAHALNTGNVVRLHVPKDFGMVELDNALVIITFISTISFSLQYSQVPSYIDVNSTQFTPFVTPSSSFNIPLVIPVGSGPTPNLNPPIYQTLGIAESRIDDVTHNIATVNQPF